MKEAFVDGVLLDGRQDMVPQKLWPLPVGNLFGVGPKSVKRMHECTLAASRKFHRQQRCKCRVPQPVRRGGHSKSFKPEKRKQSCKTST